MSTLYFDNPPTKYSDQLKHKVSQIPSGAKTYVKNLFPFVNWLPKYNLIWLSGDLIAAITVAVLVIPQSLAYAKIANLPPVFGLYTSFFGVLIYPLFGTSKDISIGTSAIASLLVGQVLGKFTVTPQFLSGEWTYVDAATLLSLLSGIIILFLGVFRLGFLFHFICQPAIAGFMAGSGLTIIINQFNKIFGVPNINTSEAPYLVFGKTLINLHHSTVDAAFGISALIYLYFVKHYSQHLLRKYPQHSRLIFFFNSSRGIVVLVFSTLLCFMINHFGHFTTSPIHIIGYIPAGLGHVAVPNFNTDIVQLFVSDLPGIIILLIMEHGAIATTLGRNADYKVDMSNEMIATGLSNVFGAFFCSYPGTGAFSRSAVMSKSGTRTPLTSFFVGIIVIVSIYVCTPAFTYISTAALSAVIAHAVSDLVSGPTVWKKYWDRDPVELVIYACAFVISLFTRIDVAVYVPVLLSILVQLYRTSHPKYSVLGRLDLDDEKHPSVYFPNNLLSHLEPVDPSLVCFRPEENITFQNAAFIFEKLLDEVQNTTRRGKAPAEKVGDRPWNNTESIGKGQEKPLLQSVVLDLSGVHQMDYSGMEALIETAIAVERYSGQYVHWYIITGFSPSVRKSLLFGGFGNQRRDAKTSGRFLSDLRDQGHIPGIGPCQANRNEKTNVVTIEDISKTKPGIFKNIMGKKDKDSVVTLEEGREEKKGEWCYCELQTPTPNHIVAVYDRYPFFFHSMSDAVQAAMLRKRFIEDHRSSLDNISVISDRGDQQIIDQSRS